MLGNLEGYSHTYIFAHLWTALLFSGENMVVRELGLFSLEKAQGNLLNVYKYLVAGHKESGLDSSQ